jgi:hypothetical protein
LSAVLFYLPFPCAFRSNGAPAPQAKAHFYESGTTTPLAIYTTSDLTTEHPNPVVADAAGRFADIYLDNTKTYRLVINDKNDASLGVDLDPYIPGTAPDAGSLQPYADACAASAVATAADRTQTGLDAATTTLNAASALLNATNAAVSEGNASDSETTAANYAASAVSSLSAILLALAGTSLGTATVAASSRAVMQNLAAAFSAGIPAALMEGPRAGLFLPMTAATYAATLPGRTLAADIATDNATLDSYQGNLIIPIGGDRTGASGAYVYPYWSQDVSGRLFGVKDGTDVKAGLEAWANVVWNLPCVSASCAVTGTAALPTAIGNTTQCLTKKIFLTATINATATMDALLTITKPNSIDLNLTLWGSSSSTAGQAWASRSAGYGVVITDAQNSKITGKITCLNFKFWGVLINDSIGVNGNNSNYATLPYIRGTSCGISNAAGGTSAMSATWSLPTRIGSSGDIAQTWSAKVTAAPTTDAVLGTVGWLYWVAGYPYGVKSMADNGDGTSTLTFYAPWVDDTSYASGAGTGTGHYTVGGVCAVRGTDSNIIPIEAVFGLNCGYVFWDGTAYGATARRLSTDGGCDVLYAFGRFNNGFHYGGGFDELYIEGTAESAQVLSISPTTAERVTIGHTTGQEVNFAKWFKFGPRANAGADAGLLYNQNMTELLTVAGYAGKQVVAGYGCDFTATWDPASCANGTPVTTTLSIPAALGKGQPLRARFLPGLQGLLLSAYVSDSSFSTKCTVTAQLANPSSAGAVDLASGSLVVTLLQT